MEELKLLEPQPKKKTWLQERIDDFLEGFKQTTGKNCPIPYPQLIGMLANKANDALNGWASVDEHGEIVKGYPDMDPWIEQRQAFFQDEFAGRKAGFAFGYFLKQFGTFVKYEPVKRKMPDPSITHVCTNCKSENTALRSQWLRMPPRVGCFNCKTPFNTKDALNQTPQLKNFL